jgi:hypothetical protein
MMSDESKVYKIPKTWVWAVIFLTGSWWGYKVYDWLKHVNWPPVDLSNQAFIKEFHKKFNCLEGADYTVTKEMLRGDVNPNTRFPVGIDRRAFFEKPECAALGLYLPYEGSGIRDEFNIYDMTTKQKTANIVITHESFKHQ